MAKLFKYALLLAKAGATEVIARATVERPIVAIDLMFMMLTSSEEGEGPLQIEFLIVRVILD